MSACWRPREDLLACGYGSVCLIDSDSPTVPAAAFEQAIAELQKEGDRIVLGPSQDGGYYLIGLKRAHSEVFTDITWSTSCVFAETVAAAKSAGIEVVVLPLWYDVDDGETLGLLTAELLRRCAATIYDASRLLRRTYPRISDCA